MGINKVKVYQVKAQTKGEYTESWLKKHPRGRISSGKRGIFLVFLLRKNQCSCFILYFFQWDVNGKLLICQAGPLYFMNTAFHRLKDVIFFTNVYWCTVSICLWSCLASIKFFIFSEVCSSYSESPKNACTFVQCDDNFKFHPYIWSRTFLHFFCFVMKCWEDSHNVPCMFPLKT